MLVENPNEKLITNNKESLFNLSKDETVLDSKKRNFVKPVLASRFKRWLASVINSVIFYLFYIGILWLSVLLFRNTTEGYSISETDVDLIVFAMMLVIFILYFLIQIILMYRTGQTLGKRLLKIRVVDYGYQPLPFLRYFLREALDQIFGILTFPILISAVIAFSNQDRQSLTDKIMGTLVIKAD